MKSLILGAGFTGLAAGIKTGLPIFEASDKAGGICTSYRKDGFEFAVGGGHWLFGKGLGLEYVKSVVPVKEYERRAGVYFTKTFDYPFQTAAKQEAIYTPGNMKAWMHEKFGLEACNLFFDPFNEKYTAGLYDKIIQYDEYKTPPPGGKGFCPTFGDPEGGLAALVGKMTEQCNIKYGKRAIEIDTQSKIVVFQDGTEEYYDKLVSTIPLNQLLHICGKKDFTLPYTSVLVLNIGADPGVNTPKEHWLYIPFCKTNFYRIGFYSNVDASKAPEGKVGLSVEMAFHGWDYDDLDVPYIIQEVVAELQSWGMISKVITTDPTWVKCAYTWLTSREHRDEQLAWLKDRDIISTGRYGKWHFCGMTESIKMGFEVVDQL